MRMRKIEMYIGTDDNKWFTAKVQIPLATPEHLIEPMAIACCKEQLVQLRVRHEFVGVREIPFGVGYTGEPAVGTDWLLFVNEGKGGLPVPCDDVEDCLNQAALLFQCTDEQLAELRNGVTVTKDEVRGLRDVTLRIGRLD